MYAFTLFEASAFYDVVFGIYWLLTPNVISGFSVSYGALFRDHFAHPTTPQGVEIRPKVRVSGADLRAKSWQINNIAHILYGS